MSNWNVLCLPVFLIPLFGFYTKLSEYFIQDGEHWILTRNAHEPFERRQDGEHWILTRNAHERLERRQDGEHWILKRNTHERLERRQDGEPWILTRNAHEPLERRQDGSRYVIPSYSSNYVLFLAMISHVWWHEVRRRVHTTWVCIDSEGAHCKVVYNSDYTCFYIQFPVSSARYVYQVEAQAIQ